MNYTKMLYYDRIDVLKELLLISQLNQKSDKFFTILIF